MNILIIGGGEIGKALGKVLESTGQRIQIWDKEKKRNLSKEKLDDLLPLSEIIFLCVPAHAITEVCQKIATFSGPIVCLSKGVDINFKFRMDEVLNNYFGNKRNYALCYGPMLAEEIMAGGGGVGVVATKDKDIFSVVKNVFSNTPLIIEFSDDLTGVALGGILKNIYAIFMGSLEGLEWNSNLKSFFAGQALKEMKDVMEFLGGKEESFWLSSGLADFIATAGSSYSSNHSFGKEVILKGDSEIEPEGIFSYKYINSSLGDKKDNYPILKLVGHLVAKDEKVKNLLEDLLNR